MKKISLVAIIVLALSVPASMSALAQSTTSAQTNLKPYLFISAERNGNIKLNGTLKSISGTTLIVSSWGGDWNVDATNAKLQRRLGGASSFSEFMVGDELTVQGVVSQSGAWSINAKVIRDEWVQVKNADFSGTISNLDTSSNTFSLTTKSRGVLQITANSSTKVYLNRKSIGLSDLADNMKARVQGVWDRNMSAVTANSIHATAVKSNSETTPTSTNQ